MTAMLLSGREDEGAAYRALILRGDPISDSACEPMLALGGVFSWLRDQGRKLTRFLSVHASISDLLYAPRSTRPTTCARSSGAVLFAALVVTDNRPDAARQTIGMLFDRDRVVEPAGVAAGFGLVAGLERVRCFSLLSEGG